MPAPVSEKNVLKAERHQGEPDQQPKIPSAKQNTILTIVTSADRLVRGHLAIGLDAVLQAVELPAGIAELDAGLSNVQRDDFTHGRGCLSSRLESLLKMNRKENEL